MKRKEKNQMDLSKKMNLLQIQKDMLTKALGSNIGSHTWKILIFDSYNRSIVSSQLKMKDLRDQNITLYLSLNQNRQQIHGVTVMYLVQPTIENIEIIANDLLEEMYTSVYIHFSSQPSTNVLSTFAKKISLNKKKNVSSRISKIEFSCTGYYAIDQSMCVLPTQIQLVNLLRSLSYEPIFIYNSSNQNSKKFVDKVKTQLTSLSLQSELQSSKKNFIILFVFNREADYFPILSHGITYASLLQNLFKINKIGSKVTKNKQTVQISLQDQIWLEKKNYLISEMKLGEQSNEISSKLIGMSSEQYSQNNEKLKKIQWHLNNAGEMIAEAKNRRLNQFYETELEIYNKGIISKQLKKDILTLLKEGPEAEDKIRLMLIYIIYADNIDELEQFQIAFPQISKNQKFMELKEKKKKGLMPQSASNKYIKKFAKGIWKNLMAGEKKFRITKELERIKGSQFAELSETGLTVDSITSIPVNVKIHRNIVFSLGGACFHEYGNLMEFDPDIIYASDQLISYRDII